MRWVTISINTIKQNIKKIKRTVGSECKICAVVKADAYGLGAVPISKNIEDEIDFFAVATVLEAKDLRDAGIVKPILIFYVCEDYELAKKLDCHVTIGSVSEAKKTVGCKVHIKINTGMNRFGIKTMRELREVLELLMLAKNDVVGVYTHLAFEKDRLDKIEEQLTAFEPFRKTVKQLFPNAIVHAVSSGAIGVAKAHFDMVRPGKALYGGVDGFKTAITIKSSIAATQKVDKTEHVGYSGKGKCNGAVGVVPMGYADCFNRNNSNCGQVLINGKQCSVVGNVCMDCFMVEASKGEVVVMADKPGVTLMEVSRRTNTIVCELLCNLHLKRCIVEYENNSRQV